MIELSSTEMAGLRASPKGLGKNKMPRRALIFRSDLFDPKSKGHRNTLWYFEDQNLSLTQRLGKIAISGWILISA